MKIEILSEPIISKFGHKLELALENTHKVFLPLDADWGYAFKIEVKKIIFDIVIYEDENENQNRIEISPDFTIIQKLVNPKYLIDLQNLIEIVKDKVINIQKE